MTTTQQQYRQQLVNCALLVAYVHGQPGGWYGIAQGSADGFPCDYAIIHDNPGNLECHPIRAFYLAGGESDLEELEYARKAVAEYRDGELPLVTTLAPEEIQSSIDAVREAWAEALAHHRPAPEDPEAWLRSLCSDSVASDLSCCNWDAVLEALALPDAA